MADTITTWTPISAPTDFRDDAVFNIDFKTKTVQVLVEQPIVAGENLSQFIKFQAPRFYDNIDLTEMMVNILYVSPTGNKGISTAVNTEYSEDMIRCGWLVPYAACPQKGTLHFVLEFVGTDYTLKTTIASTPVLDSINDADAVPEPTEQAWYIALQSNVSATLQAAQTALGRIESIFNALSTPTAASDASEMLDESTIYVYTGSETGYTYGDWYYYDGEDWVSGGEYASTALVTDSTLSQSGQPADAAAVGEALADKADKDDVPETVTPEETDADFYLSDSNGNVILELADGHIRTKHFDSSNIDIETETDTTFTEEGKPADSKAVGDRFAEIEAEIADIEPSGGGSDVDAWSQSTDTDADLHISDTRGNSLVRFSGGQIRTAKFNSDNGIYEQRKAYTNTSGTITLNQYFPQGSKVALHLTIHEKRNGDIIANSQIAYSYTDKAGTVHSIGSDYGYNFLTYVLETDAVSFTASYGTGLNWGENCTLSFKVYSIGDVPRSPHILEVAPSGKQFSSIRSAIEYAKQTADAINRFEIHIYPGTYDILSYFTAEEIADSSFEGLFVTNGISLIGIGQRSEIILTATMDDTQYTIEQRNRVCTLNVHGNVTLKNMTIKSEKIRYAIHDDYQLMSHQEDVHVYEKVTFTAKTNTSGENGEYTFGAGGGNSKKLIFKDCEFVGAVGIHTTPNMAHEYTSYLENCRARVMTFTDYNSVIQSHIYLHNCDVSIIKFSQNGTHDQFMTLEGTGVRDVIVDCPAGYVYAFDGVHKVPKASISAGYAVNNATTLATVQITTSVTDVYGISLGVANGATYVQTEGWINSKTLGLSNLSVGDYLTINSSGKVVSGGTASNAIAQVKLVDYNGTAYAKLMI